MEPPPRFSDAEYGHLVLHVEHLLERAGQIPYPDVQDEVFVLLQALDALHREALTRLVERVRSDAPDVAETFAADPAVHALLTLYDLGPDEPLTTLNGFVPLDEVDVLEVFKRPIWMPGGRLDTLEPGTLAAKSFEGVSVLLCRVGTEVFALRNACLDSILTLQQGRLEGHVLVCPWHGCRYDVRTGAIDDGSGRRLLTFPVEVGEGGRFSVGFNMD